MACIAFYDKYNVGVKDLSVEAGKQGSQCVVSNYATACNNKCNQMEKGYQACYDCLSNVQTCSRTLADDDKTSVACCPNIAIAIPCSNCLNRHNQNDLQACLQDNSLSTGAIIGIVVGVLVFIVVLIVGIRAGVKVRQRDAAKQSLEKELSKKSPGDKRALQAIQSLGSTSLSTKVFTDVQSRLKYLAKPSSPTPTQVSSSNVNNSFSV